MKISRKLILGVFVSLSIPAYANTTDDLNKASESAEKVSTEICNNYIIYGGDASSSEIISGKADLSLFKMKKIIDLDGGINIGEKSSVELYSLLKGDLLPNMKDTRNCKMHIFDVYMDQFKKKHR